MKLHPLGPYSYYYAACMPATSLNPFTGMTILFCFIIVVAILDNKNNFVSVSSLF